MHNLWLLKFWGTSTLLSANGRNNRKDAKALGVSLGAELKQKRAEIAAGVCVCVLACFFFMFFFDLI